MKDPKETCTDWQTVVREFQAGTSPGYVEKTDNIPEKEFCISMPDVPDIPVGPQGRPIDANLAVRFISDLYIAVKAAYGPADIDDLDIDELKALYGNARDFLNKIVKLNYGMTIDRDFALKLLSQPKCEGIRGYLCLKKDNDQAPLSLVTVGVDCNGFDLHFNKPDTIAWAKPNSRTADLPAAAVQNVAMQSLAGEYVTPPYTLDLLSYADGKKDQSPGAKFYKRFVLLNIATGQKDSLKF